MTWLASLWAALTSGVALWAEGGILALIISFMIGKYIDVSVWDAVYKGVKALFFTIGMGITVTVNTLTKGLWNKLVEPIFKLLLEAVVRGMVDGITEGLDSDNNTSAYGKQPKKINAP